jgi:hypothetical protein
MLTEEKLDWNIARLGHASLCQLFGPHYTLQTAAVSYDRCVSLPNIYDLFMQVGNTAYIASLMSGSKSAYAVQVMKHCRIL